MSELFSPLTQRSITFRNRIGISPMCQYSSTDGLPNAWHETHLVSRAVGGAGLIITEAAAVEPIGRISPSDAGIWNDEQAEAWSRITKQIASHGAVPGIQLAHAGRKASTDVPWQGRDFVPPERGGWQPVGASATKFADNYAMPAELSVERIEGIRDRFVESARRAVDAGFKLIEIHAAHGYLLHSFYSPLANHRTDSYGGDFDNRIRFTLETASAVRRAVPDALPVWVRISTTDWIEGGWSVEDSVELSRRLKDIGIDAVDCSSGGNALGAKIPVGPGYQVPAAARVRQEAGVATAAVGMITDATQAQSIVRDGQADLILIARQSLRDPYWPIHAARELGVPDACKPPIQYARGF
jgi:2,4-dienoyl-CoA reductase-like NADH-dependent reductase (Old Yellow Enzyme family)